jgi:hypothetical protein
MDVLEAVLYIILILILIALIGILSWLIYDYYEYKKVVKSKITETVEQSDESNSLLKKDLTTDYDMKFDYTSNYIVSSSNYIIADYDKKFGIQYDYIKSTSNILRNEYREYNNNTSNILRAEYRDFVNNTSNILRPEYREYNNNTSNILKAHYINKFDNSSSNLNKFFTFGLNDNNSINDRIYNRTWDVKDDEKLLLIRETIAKNNLTSEKLLRAEKGAKIYTEAGVAGASSLTNNKGLELCNKTGELCWNLYVDTVGDLKVAKPNDVAYNLSFTELGAQPK